MEEENEFDLPEKSSDEIIEKISALAWRIRNDWSDPRTECRYIVKLCDKLKVLNNASL